MGCMASKGDDEDKFEHNQVEKQLQDGHTSRNKEIKILMLG